MENGSSSETSHQKKEEERIKIHQAENTLNAEIRKLKRGQALQTWQQAAVKVQLIGNVVQALNVLVDDDHGLLSPWDESHTECRERYKQQKSEYENQLQQVEREAEQAYLMQQQQTYGTAGRDLPAARHLSELGVDGLPTISFKGPVYDAASHEQTLAEIDKLMAELDETGRAADTFREQSRKDHAVAQPPASRHVSALLGIDARNMSSLVVNGPPGYGCLSDNIADHMEDTALSRRPADRRGQRRRKPESVKSDVSKTRGCFFCCFGCCEEDPAEEELIKKY